MSFLTSTRWNTSRDLDNITSRAAQSHSVYVSMLKIPIEHTDGVSKSLRQKYFVFFRASGHIVSAGKKKFRDNNGDRDSAH